MSVAVSVSAGAGQARGEWMSATDGQIVLHLDRAYAPGAPLTVRALLEDVSLSLAAKTIGSKKREGGFEVRAKLFTLSRQDRERISRVFG